MYCSRELHNHHSYLPPPTEYRHCKVTVETRSKKSSDPHHDSARAPTTHISCLPPQQALTLNQQTGILLWGSHLVMLKAYTSHACFLVFAHIDLPPWNKLLLPFTLLNSAHLWESSSSSNSFRKTSQNAPPSPIFFSLWPPAAVRICSQTIQHLQLVPCHVSLLKCLDGLGLSPWLLYLLLWCLAKYRVHSKCSTNSYWWKHMFEG